MQRCWGIACGEMRRCLTVATAWRRVGRWSIRFWTCGARRRRKACRYILPEAGVRGNRSFCSNAAGDGGTTLSLGLSLGHSWGFGVVNRDGVFGEGGAETNPLRLGPGGHGDPCG